MDALLTMAMVESVVVLGALTALVVVATRSLRGLPDRRAQCLGSVEP